MAIKVGLFSMLYYNETCIIHTWLAFKSINKKLESYNSNIFYKAYELLQD